MFPVVGHTSIPTGFRPYIYPYNCTGWIQLLYNCTGSFTSSSFAVCIPGRYAGMHTSCAVCICIGWIQLYKPGCLPVHTVCILSDTKHTRHTMQVQDMHTIVCRPRYLPVSGVQCTIVPEVCIQIVSDPQELPRALGYELVREYAYA